MVAISDEAQRILSARDRRRWRALMVISVGQLMTVVDSSAVNVALPTIEHQLFHFSQASLAWVVNAYLLTFGGLLLLGGRLGDLIGRKRLFLIGLATFSVASILCGVAPIAGVLVAARFLQGACAALLSSMVLGILTPMFPDLKERVKALSIFGAVTVGGVVLGLPLGGILTEYLGWHWIFFINVPIGIATLVLGVRLLDTHAGLGIRAGADLFGALLVTAAPMAIVYALIQTSSDGWGSIETIALFATAIVLGALFIFVESHVKTPLIPLHIFQNHNLVSANFVRVLFAMGNLGLTFGGSLFLQHVLGYSPLRTGLAFVPNGVAIAVVSLAVVPVMIRRVGPKPLILTGLVLVGAGLALFARVPLHAHYVSGVLPAVLLTGLGAGLTFTPSVGVALTNVAPAESGAASGLTMVAVQMGGSFGIALLASVSDARAAHLLASGVAAPEALAAGFHLAFWVSTICVAAAFLAATVLLRSRRANAAATVVAGDAALSVVD